MVWQLQPYRIGFFITFSNDVVIFPACLLDPHVDDTVPHPCSCFVDADVIGDNIGIWYAAIRQLLPHELNKYKTINDLQTKSPDEWKENKNFTTDYAVVVGEIGCGYMEHGDSTMKTNGVKVKACAIAAKSINSPVC